MGRIKFAAAADSHGYPTRAGPLKGPDPPTTSILGVPLAMLFTSSEISSLKDLRGFAERTICDRHQLMIGAFQIHERVLIRNGRTCGLHFTLRGPRAVQFSAIWDATRHTMLFYDDNGERFHRCELSISAGLKEEWRC